jgi:hypothetical protein
MQMGYVKTSPHIVRCGDKTLQKPPRLAGEWTTVIETLSATGRTVPPYLIFPAKKRSTAWTKTLDQLPDGNSLKQSFVDLSDDGWASIENARTWLEHFHLNTWPHLDGLPLYAPGLPARLLIMSCHDTHVSIDFLEFARQWRIVLLDIPSQVTQLLQPLNVGIFSHLKSLYTAQITQIGSIAGSPLVVDKDDFLQAYSMIRDYAFAPFAQQDAFSLVGICPINIETAVERLCE